MVLQKQALTRFAKVCVIRFHNQTPGATVWFRSLTSTSLKLKVCKDATEPSVEAVHKTSSKPFSRTSNRLVQETYDYIDNWESRIDSRRGKPSSVKRISIVEENYAQNTMQWSSRRQPSRLLGKNNMFQTTDGLNLSPSHPPVEILFEQICRRNPNTNAKDVLQDMSLPEVELQALLRKLRENKRYQECIDIFTWAQRRVVTLQNGHYDEAMRSTNALGEWDMTLKMYSDMKAGQTRGSLFTLKLLIAACTGKKDLDRALHYWEELQEPVFGGVVPDAVACTLLMRACVEGNKPHLVMQVWDEMARAGVRGDGVALSTLFSALGKAGAWREALGVYRQIIPRRQSSGSLDSDPPSSAQSDSALQGSPLTTEAMNALIAACAREGRWAEAVELFSEMQQSWRGTPVDRITCNTLLHACGTGGQWGKAQEVYSAMKGVGMTPDLLTFNTLLAACARNQGTWQQAQDLVKELREMGFEEDVHTYTALLNICANCQKGVEAEKLLTKMQIKGIPLQVGHYRCVARALSDSGRVERAAALVMQPQTTATLLDSQADPRTWVEVLRAASREGNHSLVLKLYSHVERHLHDSQPSGEVYVRVIAACARSLEQSRSQSAKSNGGSEHEVPEAGDLAIQVFEKLVDLIESEGMGACQEGLRGGFEDMLKCCTYTGSVELAMEVCRRMTTCGVAPELRDFSLLLQACASHGDAGVRASWTGAAVRVMQAGGQTLHGETFQHLAALGAFQGEQAYTVFKSMQALGMQADTSTYSTLLQTLLSSSSHQTHTSGMRTSSVQQPSSVSGSLYLHGESTSPSHSSHSGLRDLRMTRRPTEKLWDISLRVMSQMLHSGLTPTESDLDLWILTCQTRSNALQLLKLLAIRPQQVPDPNPNQSTGLEKLEKSDYSPGMNHHPGRSSRSAVAASVLGSIQSSKNNPTKGFDSTFEISAITDTQYPNMIRCRSDSVVSASGPTLPMSISFRRNLEELCFRHAIPAPAFLRTNK